MVSAAQNNDPFSDLLSRADAGDAQACAKVGHIFAAGDAARGIPADRVKAAKYYEAGAAAGDLDCMFGIAATYLHNNDTQKAIAMLQTCAGRHHPRALAVLGDFYLTGHDVPKDPRTAFLYLQEYTNLYCAGAAQQGAAVKWDVVLYPLCLLLGVGCDKDEQAAFTVLRQLADLGNLSARGILGTGMLEDAVIGDRFGFDIRDTGPQRLFTPAPQDAQRRQPLLQAAHKPQRLNGFLQKSLIPDEKVLMQAHFPFIFTLDAFLRMIVLTYAGLWICRFLALRSDDVMQILPQQATEWIYHWPLLPLYVCGVIGFCMFASMMIEKWTTTIVLTDRRFLYKRGLLAVEMIQMNFWQIEHTDVTQSPLGSLRDYGHVLVQSYALGPQEDNVGGMLRLPLISHPYMFTRIIEDHRRAPAYGNRQNMGPGSFSYVQGQ